MKKWLTAAAMALTMTMMSVPAMALEYNVEAPEGGLFAGATSVDPVTVVGSGVTESSNIDRSKNAAVMPPAFGSPESYQEGTGTALIPQTSSSINGATGAAGVVSAVTGISDTTYYPPAQTNIPGSAEVTVSSANLFTLPDGLYYSDGSLGKLEIPILGLSVKVYEDESLESLAKGAGHFKSTSCWDGNIGLAGHNRGVTNHFGKIHTLTKGDKIIYTTKLGTRTYEVFFVGKIEETEFSRLGRTSENMITLVTCVQNVPNMRWCVQARQIS